MIRVDGHSIWALRTLKQQGMPAAEICSVLLSDDPETVHRHLELHRESLAEQLGVALRMVDLVERLLARRLEDLPLAACPVSPMRLQTPHLF